MGRNKKTTADSADANTPQARQRSGAPASKPRRNRSKKQRPQDVAGIIAALNDGALDLRHTAARDALAVRDALKKEPRPVAAALVRDALALDAVVMARISAELLRPGSKIVDDAGNVHELISRYWPDVRAGILRGSKTLLDLERTADKATAPGDGHGPLDISAIILEAQADADRL